MDISSVMLFKWHLSLRLRLSLLWSDNNGLSECSCDSVALRQKVAALWMWGENRKKKEIASRLPRHQKETLFFFHFLPGLWEEKKCKEEVKSAEGGDGEIAGRSAKKRNSLVWEAAWRAAQAWRVSQRKNWTNVQKKEEKKHQKKWQKR